MGFEDLIRIKRDGGELRDELLRALVDGITDGRMSDAQVAAFAMAVFLRGLCDAERATLTAAMRDSGRVLSWRDVTDRPVLDKHSTGGVGDKVSLPLAAILAAAGAAVPMISGRALGHTGGTLDKLESIPGYATAPDVERFRSVVAEVGCAIIGQTADLAPADRRLYAIRDATGSVESVPLIVASILSKKLAAGLDGLVLDVKHGNGAFMADLGDARSLARALVDVARDNGLPAVAVLTDMNAVLGTTAGNAVEVAEAIAMLKEPGAADPRLVAVTLELAERVLEPHGLEPARARRVLDDGSAAERFAVMVAALGGPVDLLERPERHLPEAPLVRRVFSPSAGWVTAHDARSVGSAVIALGGGRLEASGGIPDHAVGLSAIAPVGTEVGPDRPLAIVHARDEPGFALAADLVRGALTVGERVAAAGAVTEVLR